MIHLKKLNDRKLNIYRIIAPAGVVSTLLITYLEMSRLPLTMFDYISRAVIIIVYTVLTYQLWFREGAGPLFERTVFWIIALFFGSQFFRLVYNLHIDDYSNALLTLPHWLPIVYLMAFLTFDFNQAIKAGSAFFITILLPGIFFIVLHPESVHLSHIINIYVSNIIYLFVIYATGSLMRQYAQSELLKQQAEKENRALQERWTTSKRCAA